MNLGNFSGSDALGYFKSISSKVKQMALNLTDLEVKVEEATNNEPWGPHGTVMAGILLISDVLAGFISGYCMLPSCGVVDCITTYLGVYVNGQFS